MECIKMKDMLPSFSYPTDPSSSNSSINSTSNRQKQHRPLGSGFYPLGNPVYPGRLHINGYQNLFYTGRCPQSNNLRLSYSTSFNSGNIRLIPPSSGPLSWGSTLHPNIQRSTSLCSQYAIKGRRAQRKDSKLSHMSDNHFNYLNKSSTANNFKLENESLPYNNISYNPHPSNLPISKGYTSFSRLQPLEGATYREPPILNDKFFPRDPPWGEDIGGNPYGPKAPHLQLRGIIVETKGPNGGGWTPLLDGISIEVKGGEVIAIMATTG